MSYCRRSFGGSPDMQLVVDWVRAIRASERMADYPSVIELPQLLLLPRNQETVQLWFADTGALVGFAFVDAFHTLRFEVDWRHTTPALEAEITAWGNDCIAKNTTDAQSSTLYATSHEDDVLRLSYLKCQGFAPLADSIVHLERSLITPIAVPQLLSGFTIRSVEGEHEAAEVATLHREAFGTPHMTTERRLAMMRTVHYDSALDLVAATPEGVLVAYGAGSLSPEENILTRRNACYADLFATHPAYRGHGLARAILVRLLSRLHERGFDTAKLNTNSENVPMLRIATSEGFRPVSWTFRFARPVSSTPPRGPALSSNQEALTEAQKSPLDVAGITLSTPITREGILQSIGEGRRDYE